MTIYDLKDLLASTLHNHEVSNGEFIPDATFTLTLEQGKAILDLLGREIDVRKRRASAGGRGFSSPARQEAWKAAQAKGVAARQTKALAKKAGSQ